MRFLRAIAGLAMLAAAAHAQHVQVVSPRPDSVSVTIYRDLFALITETRTVDLPEGPVTLVFEGVAETLIPQSAVVADTQRAVDESNFDFERITPAALLDKSIGKQVTLTRTNRATGKVRQVPAVVVAANSKGVVFRSSEGNEALWCSGLPEMLTFESVPEGLQSTPRLSIRLAAGTAGKRQVRVSYLAHGFAWSADYLGQLSANAMDLSGWITLRNLTGSTFRGAEVQLVAGKLHLLDAEEERGTSLYGNSDWVAPTDEALQERRDERLQELMEELEQGEEDRAVEFFYGCYPLGNTSMRAAMGVVDAITAEDIGQFPDMNVAEALQRVAGVEMLDEVVVTGFRASMAVRENLADYQLYRLPVHTDLNARQTKQVAFLRKPAVKVDRFYGLRIARDEEYLDDGQDALPANIKIAWHNRESDGLGEPLPAGTIRMFEKFGADTIYSGDDRLEDSPVNTPMEVSTGRAPDLSVVLDGDVEEPTQSPSRFSRRVSLPVELRVINAKARPVTMEIRQGLLWNFEDDQRVTGASLAPKRKAGDYVWRFTVPANGETRLSYKIVGREPGWDE